MVTFKYVATYIAYMQMSKERETLQPPASGTSFQRYPANAQWRFELASKKLRMMIVAKQSSSSQ